MSFWGYVVVLHHPLVEPEDYSKIAETFTEEYFKAKLLEKWPDSTLRRGLSDELVWTIPSLDSGDPDNPFFLGRFEPEYKSITFMLTPHETIATFLKWVRSIVPSETPVYFMDVGTKVILAIHEETTREDIYWFLKEGLHSPPLTIFGL